MATAEGSADAPPIERVRITSDGSLRALSNHYEIRELPLTTMVTETMCAEVLRVSLDPITMATVELDFFAQRTITTGQYKLSHIQSVVTLSHWCSATYNTACDDANRIEVGEISKVNSIGSGLGITDVQIVKHAGQDYVTVKVCAGNNGTGGSTSWLHLIATIRTPHNSANVRLEAI